MSSRIETRRQRYDAKLRTARTIPVSIATVNFNVDENLGFVIRAAGRFGARRVMVVGNTGQRSRLMPSSGSLIDYVELVQFHTPHDLLQYTRDHNLKLVAAELCDGSMPLFDYRFDFDRETVIVVGNEQSGVPAEILYHADKVMIDMAGVGFCLNTSQAANVMLYEYARQFKELR
jgi:tRNA G18 (ribose-2'-O)-methylase SpoU